MSTPDQPDGPGLTRKQLREIRMTGATPVIDPDAANLANDVPAAAEPEPAAVPAVPVAAMAGAPAAPAVPLPRAAEPAVAAPAPRPDAQVDLGVAPLTRRQAREQERIRTASVPVITPDVMAAHTAPWAPPPVLDGSSAPSVGAQTPDASDDEAGQAGPTITELFALPRTEPLSAADEEPESEDGADAQQAEEATLEEESDATPASIDAADTDADADATPEQAERPVLRPEFGATLLAAEEPSAPLAPSFDELIARGTTSAGSTATPNALILPQSAMPLTSPVAATGEVLVTGTYELQGLGSRGHAPGTTDGREADAVLIDGELPPASSPTPIAASAAISTVKGTGEIIRPPAPEKGNKLMLGLAITAGVLAVALIGVLVVAFATGVFS